MENVIAGIRRAHMDASANMPELAMRHNELRPRRILDVTSRTSRADFYVVELVDQAGKTMANVAIQKSGLMIGVEQTRGIELPRSMDATAAARRARAVTASVVRGVTYIHMLSEAEPGSPIFAPLAAVDTADGTIYVNSKGEASADESSTIATLRGIPPQTARHPAFAKLVRLR